MKQQKDNIVFGEKREPWWWCA